MGKELKAVAMGVKGVDYPPLKVEIRDGAKVLKVVEMTDPRQEFCRFYNEQQGRVAAMQMQATRRATKAG